MSGLCSDDDQLETDFQKQCILNEQPFDFIILPNICHDSLRVPQATIWDVRFIGATSDIAKPSETHGEDKTLKKHAVCKSILNKPKKGSSSRFKQKRLPYTKSLTFSRPSQRLFSCLEKQRDQNQDQSGLWTPKNIVKFNLTDLCASREVFLPTLRDSCSSGVDLVNENFPKLENSQFCEELNGFERFLIFNPTAGSWDFELDDSALVRSLKINMASASDSCPSGADQLMVNYDTSCSSCPINTCQSEEISNNDGPTAASYEDDRLYECALEFAKTHGYGFVKFVEEEEPEFDEESAKKMRRKLERTRRRAFQRAKLIGSAKRGVKTSHQGFPRPRVSTRASILKLGTATCRGICGGRPRNPETFWQRAKPGVLSKIVQKNPENSQQISRDIHKAISAETWLDASPECREHIRRCFYREKSKAYRERQSLSPKRGTIPDKPLNAKSRTCSSSISPRSRPDNNSLTIGALDVNPKKSQSDSNYTEPAINLSPRRTRQMTPNQTWAFSKNRQKGTLQTQSKERLCERKEKVVKYSSEESTERDGFNSSLKKTSNSAFQYRHLVREMCDMIGSGFFPVWSKENGACGGESLESVDADQNFQKKNTTSAMRHTKHFDVDLQLKDQVHMESESNISNNPGDEANFNDQKHLHTEHSDLWLPGIMSKHTNKHYRLCNSLSAAILREAQLSSPCSSKVNGRNKIHLLAVPLEVVHAGNTLFESKASDEGNSQENKIHEQSSFSENVGSKPEGKEGKIAKTFENHGDLCIQACNSEFRSCDQNQESWETFKNVGLSSVAASKCVRNRRSSKMIAPQHLKISVSPSGHLMTRSDARASSCPNFVDHSFNRHRRMFNRAFSTRKSESPSPNHIQTCQCKDSFCFGCDYANRVSSRNILFSPIIGDHGNFPVDFLDENDDKASLIDIHQSCKDKGTFHPEQHASEEIKPTPLLVSGPQISPELAKRHNCLRTKCSSPLKNISLRETSPAAENEELCQNSKALFSSDQVPSSTNESIIDINQTIKCSLAHECNERLVHDSTDASVVLQTDNVNNNAGWSDNNLDSTFDINNAGCRKYSANEENFLTKINKKKASSETVSSSIKSCNNNALSDPSGNNSNALPNVPSSSGRSKLNLMLKSIEYQESASSQSDYHRFSNNKRERHSSSPQNEPLKLPVLPNARPYIINSQVSPEMQTFIATSQGPKTSHKNGSMKYESISNGFGPTLPLMEDCGEDSFKAWETQKRNNTEYTVSLPPALCDNLNVRGEKKDKGLYNEDIHKQKNRAHPLNRSYVISRDDDEGRETTGDFFLKLPTAVSDIKPDRQQVSKLSNASRNNSNLESNGIVGCRQNSYRMSPLIRKAELQIGVCVADERKGSFKLKPNVSLRSPEFSTSRDSERDEAKMRTSIVSSEHPLKCKMRPDSESSDFNNNSFIKETPPTKITKGCCKENEMLSNDVDTEDTWEKYQNNIGANNASLYSNNGTVSHLNRFVINAWTDDIVQNVSNNASYTSYDDDCDKKETTPVRSNSNANQHSHERERQTNSSIDQASHTTAVTNPPVLINRQDDVCRDEIESTVGCNNITSEHNFTLAGHRFINMGLENANNASSMNLSTGREREHLRRRHLNRDSFPTGNITCHENHKTNSHPSLQETQSPMELSETSRHPFRLGQSRGSRPETTSCFRSLRYPSNGMWRNMLSQDPMTRRLWSCKNERQLRAKQYIQEQQDGSHNLFNQPRLTESTQCSPTAENYWQMALDPNAPAPSLDFLYSTNPTSRNGQTKNSHDSNECIFSSEGTGPNKSFMDHDLQETENMDVAESVGFRGDEVLENSQSHCQCIQDDQTMMSSRGLSSLSDLYKQLDSLWLRSQYQMNQHLEAIGNSMNTRLKELQQFVEKHLSQLKGATPVKHDNDNDRLPKKRKVKFKSNTTIHLNRKAAKSRRYRRRVSLDTSKYKKENSMYSLNDSAMNNSKASDFPTIKFKELRTETDDEPSRTQYQRRTTVRSSKRHDTGFRQKKRRISPTFKSMRQCKNQRNSPLLQCCAMKQGSVTCYCNQKHTRSCRRRRGTEGIECIMCLLKRRQRSSRGKRAISKNSSKAKVRRRNQSVKRRSVKVFVKKRRTKAGRQNKHTFSRQNATRQCNTRNKYSVNKGNKTKKNSLAKSVAKKALMREPLDRKQGKRTFKRRKLNIKKEMDHFKLKTYLPHKTSSVNKKLHSSMSKHGSIQGTGRSSALNKHAHTIKKQRLPFKDCDSKRSQTTKRTFYYMPAKNGHAQDVKIDPCPSVSDITPYAKYKVIKREKKSSDQNASSALKNKRDKNENRKNIISLRRSTPLPRRKDKSNSSNKKLQLKNLKKQMPRISNSFPCDMRPQVSANKQSHRILDRAFQNRNQTNSNKHSHSQGNKRSMRTSYLQSKRLNVKDKNNKERSFKYKNTLQRKYKIKSVNEEVRYRITATGYSSLVEKLKTKYNSLCSVPYKNLKVSRERLRKKNSPHRLVDQFKDAVFRFMRNRFGRLRNILAHNDDSQTTTCRQAVGKSEHKMLPVNPHAQKKISKKHNTNKFEKLKACTQKHPRKRPKKARPFRNQKLNIQKNYKSRTNFQTYTPPKSHVPSCHGNDQAAPETPGTRSDNFSQPSPTDTPRLDNSEESSETSDCAPRIVDSLELNRRRLQKRHKDVSYNACCHGNIASGPENLSTGHTPCMSSKEPLSFDSSPEVDTLIYNPHVCFCSNTVIFRPDDFTTTLSLRSHDHQFEEDSEMPLVAIETQSPKFQETMCVQCPGSYCNCGIKRAEYQNDFHCSWDIEREAYLLQERINQQDKEFDSYDMSDDLYLLTPRAYPKLQECSINRTDDGISQFGKLGSLHNLSDFVSISEPKAGTAIDISNKMKYFNTEISDQPIESLDSESSSGKPKEIKLKYTDSSCGYASTVDHIHSKRSHTSLEVEQSSNSVPQKGKQMVHSCQPNVSLKSCRDEGKDYVMETEWKDSVEIKENLENTHKHLESNSVEIGQNSKVHSPLSKININPTDTARSEPPDKTPATHGDLCSLANHSHFDGRGNQKEERKTVLASPSTEKECCSISHYSKSEKIVTYHHPTLVLRYRPPKATCKVGPCCGFNSGGILRMTNSTFALNTNGVTTENKRKGTVTKCTETQAIHAKSQPSVSHPVTDKVECICDKQMINEFKVPVESFQRPQLQVRCSEICTTWMSVALEQPSEGNPAVNENLANWEQVRRKTEITETPNTPYELSSGTQANTFVRSVCSKIPISETSDLISDSHAKETASAHFQRHFERNASYKDKIEVEDRADIPESFLGYLEMGNNELQSENRTALPLCESCSGIVCATEKCIEPSAPKTSFPESDGREEECKPSYKPDSTIFLAESDCLDQTPSDENATQAIQRSESDPIPRTFCAYRQCHISDCESDDATLSTQSFIENNNNAVRAEYTKNNDRIEHLTFHTFDRNPRGGCSLPNHLFNACSKACIHFQSSAKNMQLNQRGPVLAEATSRPLESGATDSSDVMFSLPTCELDRNVNGPSSHLFTSPQIDIHSSVNKGNISALNEPTKFSEKSILNQQVPATSQNNFQSVLSTIPHPKSSSAEKTSNENAFDTMSYLGESHLAKSANGLYGCTTEGTASFKPKSPNETFRFEYRSSLPSSVRPQKLVDACTHSLISSQYHRCILAQIDPHQCHRHWRDSKNRKRRLLCPLSERLAPPRKIPRLDHGIKPLSEHRRRLLQRRVLWQQKRESRILALQEEERERRRKMRKAKKQDNLQIEMSKSPTPVCLRKGSTVKIACDSAQYECWTSCFNHSSDADCESN
ncbi:hypothetical protein PoB_005263700 [Plakobranchus ocellatus]|uniref:Uncharacterized protein n=1 Tax=Plakobranchus ocellatus TaxID=259542 RepID=A0AAV4C4C6_9GAST|nr:hypothetical protein PoB_005263700 [Plakobranchus ocellatus]